MTWLGQVGHVMAKDVRQTLWPLVLYVVVVLAATIQATQLPVGSIGVFDFVPYLVVLLGVFVTGLVVQADSPIRSDSFWATRPLYPSAVLFAKAVLALVVVFGVAFLAQVLVLRWLGTPFELLVRYASRSGWILGLWLVIATVAASVTRDLRSFIATLAAISLVFPFTRISSVTSLQRLPGLRYAVLATAVVGIAGGVALLIKIYRTRQAGRFTFVGGVITIVCMLVPLMTNPWSRARAIPVSASNDRYALYLETRTFPLAPPEVVLGIPDAITSDRITFVDSALARIRLNDGNTLVLSSSPNAVVEYPQLPVANGARWLGAPPTQGRGLAGFRMNRRQRDSLRIGIASASVDAWTVSARPVAALSVPLRTGAAQRQRGKIARVMRVGSQGDDETPTTIALTSVETPEGMASMLSAMLSFRTPSYAFVNVKRGEAVIPVQEQRGGAFASTVLPGVVRRVALTQFSGWVHTRAGEPQPIDQEWLNEADAVYFDWTPAGRARIHMDNVVVREWDPPNAAGRRPPADEMPPASRSPQIRPP